MTDSKPSPSKNQEIFRSMILGILVYSVVLGFFNDYTDILYTGTYSTTFAAAIVLQLLTFATFELKNIVVSRFNAKENSRKVWLVLSVWLIMFFSKFIFLAVIDVVFRSQVEISGFVGLLLIIIVMTLVQKIIEQVYKNLGTE